MKILSFDTSTKAASISLIEDDVLVVEIIINDKRTHSQKLIPILKSLFKLGNIDKNNIDLLAVCIGPGSFTGLRIAIATVKAFAHVKNLPIVAVNSLEALAYNLKESKKVIVPILDAQRTQVYTNEYIIENNIPLSKKDIGVVEIDTLIEEISKDKRDFIVIGEAVNKFEDKLKSIENIEIGKNESNISKSSSVGFIAKNKYENNKDVYNCYSIEPLYIRKSQAEEQYEEKLKREAKNDL